jgi:hypothetical protein
MPAMMSVLLELQPNLCPKQLPHQACSLMLQCFRQRCLLLIHQMKSHRVAEHQVKSHQVAEHLLAEH